MTKTTLLLLLAITTIGCNSYKGPKSAKAPKELKGINRLYNYIPAGIVKHDYNTLKDSWQVDSVKAFLILPTEISNQDWKEFIYWLEKNKPNEVANNLLDTTVWCEHLLYCQPYIDNYYQHVAYKEYPAVGMTKVQAEAYCDFLTEALKISFPNTKIRARLPTKLEWLRAGRDTQAWLYPQAGYLRNSKGNYLYNFKVIDNSRIDYKDSTHAYEIHPLELPYSSFDGGLITTQTGSYFPNHFGLYNMSGNVAELIGDNDKAMGGSWHSTGYNARLDSEVVANQARSTIGFRPVLEILD